MIPTDCSETQFESINEGGAFPGRLLIVDDTRVNLLFLQRLLMQEGHQVQICQRADEALALAIADPPDLLISDVNMPGMDGYQLCRALKINPQTMYIPVIFVSVLDDLAQKTQAFEVGAADYITKPFESVEVLLRVKNQLRTQTLYRRLAEQNRLLQMEVERRKLAEEQSKLAEEKFAKAFYASPNPSTITLLSNGRHLEVNDSFCQVTGYTPEEVIGKSVVELNLWVNLEDRKKLFELISTQRRVRNHEFEFRTKHGQIHTAILSCEIITLNGEECLLSLSNDITERKQAESQLMIANTTLQKLADLDGLTQIANRRRFDTYLKYHLEQAQKHQQYLAMVLCDVDHFKHYNDYYGHLQGDTCLIRLAKVFQRSLTTHKDFVARYGGEEFALILPGRSPADAYCVVQRVLEAIQRAQIPHARSETASVVTVSFGGYVLTPENMLTVATPKDLIGKADAALYRAKQRGRNCIVFGNELIDDGHLDS